MTVRVLVVDDERLVRAGYRMILQGAPDLDLAGEAADGLEAIDAVRHSRPDVVLMDIRMPRLDGIEATRRITRLPGPPAILIVTTFDLDEYVYRALRAGAGGFLLKDAPEDQVLAAVRSVREGISLFSPSVTLRLIRTFGRTDHSQVPGLTELTGREREVLVQLARGLSNADIAANLFLGEATVKTHVSRVLTKLGLTSRTQAVVAAYDAGLVVPGR